MKMIGELVQLSTAYLKGDRRTAEMVIGHVLKMKKMELYLQFDQPVIEKELEVIRELLKRCSKGEPVEYVVGEVEFYGCKIKIDSRCLIPRPETEILVDLVSKRAKTKRAKKGVLWDVCCGSGCIGIALKKANPELTVVLSDICPNALALASDNARLNEVEVTLFQGDLRIDGKPDFLVCNPPYISSSEYLTLDPSVRSFEPKLALVGGERGTEFYERLYKKIPVGTSCFFEIGSSQGELVKQIFLNEGEVHCDWAGHPRFFFYEKK